MKKAAFVKKVTDCPDFARVVFDFLHDHGRGGFEMLEEEDCNKRRKCRHVTAWADPANVPEEALRCRKWYSEGGQKAATDMFQAMLAYLQFFKPESPQALQPQVPEGREGSKKKGMGVRGEKGGDCLV